MPDLIRHPEALASGFRRNDGASDNNETVNKSVANTVRKELKREGAVPPSP
jgi:hypothetical protein